MPAPAPGCPRPAEIGRCGGAESNGRPHAQAPRHDPAYAGPLIVVSLIAFWSFGLTLGAALMAHPELGDAIRPSSGEASTDMVTALLVAGNSLSIVGSGDYLPQSSGTRLLFLFESLVGASVLSLVLSYLVQVYAALRGRNAPALSIDLMSDGTGMPARCWCGSCQVATQATPPANPDRRSAPRQRPGVGRDGFGRLGWSGRLLLHLRLCHACSQSDVLTERLLRAGSEQDGYVLADTRIGIGAPDQRWTLELWTRNLTNHRFVAASIAAIVHGTTLVGSPGEPRMAGMTEIESLRLSTRETGSALNRSQY